MLVAVLLQCLVGPYSSMRGTEHVHVSTTWVQDVRHALEHAGVFRSPHHHHEAQRHYHAKTDLTVQALPQEVSSVLQEAGDDVQTPAGGVGHALPPETPGLVINADSFLLPSGAQPWMLEVDLSQTWRPPRH